MKDQGIRPLVLLRIALDLWLVLAIPVSVFLISWAAMYPEDSLPVSMTGAVWAPLIARLIVGFRIDWLRSQA